MKKRGISGIIIVSSLILIALASVVITWNVVKSVIEKSGGDVFVGQLMVDLEVNSVYISENNQEAYVSIKRGGGEGEISALNFIFTGSSYVYKYPLPEGIPNELDIKVYNITAAAVNLQNPDFTNFESIESVGIAFEVVSSGKTIVSDVKSKFKGDLRSDTSLPNQPNIIPPYIEGGGCTNGETRQCGVTDIGPCQYGNRTCSGGTWGSCVGSIEPVDETCNNIDDNCNGAIDDGVTRNCGTDVGECEFGTETCSAGVWGSCVGGINPVTEICGDGLDSNCNGIPDLSDPACTAGGIPGDYVSWWKFETQIGGITPDERGINNGTLMNDSYIENDIAKGNVLKTDGNNDYVNIGAFDQTENIGALTISLWVKAAVADDTTTRYPFYKSSNMYMYRSSTEYYYFTVYNYTGVVSRGTYLAPKDTDWHHVVAVYNGTNVFTYIDMSKSSLNKLEGNTRTSASGFTISRPSAISAFNGSIDDVMFYNRELSDSEIQDIYNAQSP